MNNLLLFCGLTDARMSAPEKDIPVHSYLHYVTAVMPLVGGQGGLQPTRKLGVQLTLLQPKGQIMPTTLLLVHSDLKTQWHLWQVHTKYTLRKQILNTNPPHLGVFFNVYMHAKSLGVRLLGDIARKHQSFHGTQMALGELIQSERKLLA